jgi:hypothetical protein
VDPRTGVDARKNRKKLLVLLRIEPRTLGLPACILVAIPTELSHNIVKIYVIKGMFNTDQNEKEK